MTTYYVGGGGSDSNNGTSWATRKLTLNGAEDVPVAAGDTVYVGPGVYRELLTVDVSGTNGNPITYIGDVDGSHTDGIGGTVRVSGSDDDQTATRANCISASSKNYRTFVGFAFDQATTSNTMIAIASGTNWIIRQCTFGHSLGSGVYVSGATSASCLVEQCFFLGLAISIYGVTFGHTATVSDSNHIVKNCVFVACRGVQISRVGGVTINHCSFLAGTYHIRVDSALAVGQATTVNNNLFMLATSSALQATSTAEIVENYNNFYLNVADRTTVNVGANSTTYPPLYIMPMLGSGVRYPQNIFGTLSEWSLVRSIVGTGMATDDLYGITRPTTDSKKSWGPIQYVEPRRDTGTKRTGAASLKLPDASRHQIFVPTTNASTVFGVYVYWGADYAGTKPQLVVKQPGQSDTTVTATGSASNWELLTTTLTPAASPAYCVVELVSNNTAAAGAGTAAYFDDLTVE